MIASYRTKSSLIVTQEIQYGDRSSGVSMTIEEAIAEAAYEEHAWDAAMDEFRDQAILDFQQERLRSYYIERPDLDACAIEALDEARSLFDAGFIRASLVFAVSSAEQTLTNTLLRPILFGLVHSESVASLVAGLDVRLDRLPKLLFPIILEVANVDLTTYTRAGQSVTLWSEFKRVQHLRHGIVHRGEPAASTDASLALAVGSALLADILATVVAAVAPALPSSAP